jgi:hypothetical protein
MADGHSPWGRERGGAIRHNNAAEEGEHGWGRRTEIGWDTNGLLQQPFCQHGTRAALGFKARDTFPNSRLLRPKAACMQPPAPSTRQQLHAWSFAGWGTWDRAKAPASVCRCRTEAGALKQCLGWLNL